MTQRSHIGAVVASVVAIVMLAAMPITAFERNLVGTLTQHGWGRTLQGVGAALTQLRCGFAGFVIDKRVDGVLQGGGITNNVVILTQIGASYPDNLTDQKRIQTALDNAQTVNCPTLDALPDSAGHYPNLLGFNGEDAGMSTYAIFSFALFGINVPALTYGYFALALLSLSLFAIVHGRYPGAMVTAGLLTVALFLVTCSPLFNFRMPAELQALPGIDLKDPRFLGTIAAFPLLHVIVTWTRPSYRLTVGDYLALAGQMAILAFAVHIRSSTVWAMLALPLLWVLLNAMAVLGRGRGMLRQLGEWRSPGSLFVLATVCAVPYASQIVINHSLHPFYEAEGDLARHTFWDGVLQSLEYNPEWAAKYRPSFDQAAGDDLPIVAVRAAIAKLPADQQTKYLNSSDAPTRIAFEHWCRSIFLDLLSQDAGFVLYTFFVAKPLQILNTEEIMYRVLSVALTGWHLLLPIVALTILAGVATRDDSALRLLRCVAGAALVGALFACSPNWAVMSNELVMFDNLTWSLFLFCLLPVLTVGTIRQGVSALLRSGAILDSGRIAVIRSRRALSASRRAGL